MALLRRVIGDTLRGQRVRQRRTLRDVSSEARVSLGYLSEVERGQKEASSELLAAICEALGVQLSDLMHEVSEVLRRGEAPRRVVPAVPRPELAGVGASRGGDGAAAPSFEPLPAGDAESSQAERALVDHFGADRASFDTDDEDEFTIDPVVFDAELATVTESHRVAIA